MIRDHIKSFNNYIKLMNHVHGQTLTPSKLNEERRLKIILLNDNMHSSQHPASVNYNCRMVCDIVYDCRDDGEQIYYYIINTAGGPWCITLCGLKCHLGIISDPCRPDHIGTFHVLLDLLLEECPHC